MLVACAFATWVYRFFLFLGIALLVYHFAFKALGLVLFAVEIGWFIGRPIAQEIAAMLRHRWHWNRRLARTGAIAVIMLTALLVPWRSTMPLPAVMEAAAHARVHPPEAARVAAVPVAAGDRVAAGDVLVRLEKPMLDLEAEKALRRMQLIRARLDRRAESVDDLAAQGVLRRRLVEQRTRLAGLRERKADLLVRSPIDGLVVRQAELAPGQWVGREQLLAEVVGDDGVTVIAYVREQARSRLEVGATGRFIPNDGAHRAIDVRVTAVEDVGAERLPYRMLASAHGGPLPVQQARTGQEPRLDEGVYRLRLAAVGEAPVPVWRLPGRASIESPPASLAGRFLRYAASVLIRESGF